MTKGFVPASDFHVFRCFGNDAESFLQSQFTGDVSTIPDGGWALSGYCSPKGRLLAVFFVCRAQSEFLLLTHDSVSEAVIARLRMYVMRADVTLERLAERSLAFRDKRPDADPPTSNADPLFQIQDLLDVSTAEAAPVDALSERLSFQQLCIELGVAVISAPLSEMFIPQSVNLDLVGGVSFQKGCYPGQELVARVRYRGKPKQRMIRAVAEQTRHPDPGDAVLCTSGTSGRNGVVVSAGATGTPGQIQLLASVPVTAIMNSNSEELLWEETPLSIRPLPYPLPLDNLT